MAMPGAAKYEMPKFDLDLAKKLLEESGVPKDQWKITWVAYGGVDVLKNVALLYQANAAKVGVKVDIVQGEWGVMWDKQKHLNTSFNASSPSATGPTTRPSSRSRCSRPRPIRM